MLTTKYPLGVVLMELAHQMRVRRLVLRAHWLPRLENEEADALTNADFRHFKKENRIDVKLEDLKLAVLNDLFKAGEEFVSALESEKERAKLQASELEGAVPKERKQKRLMGTVPVDSCWK